MFIVTRGPSTPEDEGRVTFCGVFYTRERAESYMKDEVLSSKGYFVKNDFTLWLPEKE